MNRRLKRKRFLILKLLGELDEFKTTSDVIVTNRLCDALVGVEDKVYTRDLYKRD